MSKDPPKTELPALLWHYATFESLEGIITKGEVFASNLAYVNDTEEFQHSIKPLVNYLKDVAGPTISTLMREAGALDVPRDVQSMIGGFVRRGVYAACFSKKADDLSQWRSYSPRPPGFAIGFDRNLLREATEDYNWCTLTDCQYLNSEQLLAEIRQVVDPLILDMEVERAQFPVPAELEELQQFGMRWAAKIAWAVAPLASRNKHPTFASEEEVRLIVDPTRVTNIAMRFVVNYRLSGSLIVPYVKIPVQPELGIWPIKMIIVGPCPHQSAVIAATQQMCSQHGWTVDVISSKIPFRNW